jgi:membrane carboxypeptidase/penicillin-binding protein
MGNKETGALAALPIWIDFMRVAIAGHEDEHFADSTTGSPAHAEVARDGAGRQFMNPR